MPVASRAASGGPASRPQVVVGVAPERDAGAASRAGESALAAIAPGARRRPRIPARGRRVSAADARRARRGARRVRAPVRRSCRTRGATAGAADGEYFSQDAFEFVQTLSRRANPATASATREADAHVRRRRGLVALAASSGRARGWRAAARRAAEPPSAPILRVETAMHAALVRRLVVDPQRNRLITAGDDKTIRVWQLPQGRLVRVLRLPDRRRLRGPHLRARGEPGRQDDRCRRLDRLGVGPAGGGLSLRRRRPASSCAASAGFPTSSARSPTRRTAGISRSACTPTAGCGCCAPRDYTTVARDAEYRDKILGADFRADGRLAVAALDGQVRLYDPRRSGSLGRKRTAPGREAADRAVLAGRRQLAVSFHDVPALAVLSAADLSLAFTPDTTRLAASRRAHRGRLVGRRRIALRLRRLLRARGEPDPALARGRPRSDGAATGRARSGSPTCSRCRAAAWRSRPRIPRSACSTPPAARCFFRGPELADFPPRDAGAQGVARRRAGPVRAARADGARPVRFSLLARELLARRGGRRASSPVRSATRRASRSSAGGTRPSPVLNGVQLGSTTTRSRAPTRSAPITRRSSSAPSGRCARTTATPSLRWRADAPGVGPQRRRRAGRPDGRRRAVRRHDPLVPDGGRRASSSRCFRTPMARSGSPGRRQGYYVSSNAGDNYIGWHLNRGKDARRRLLPRGAVRADSLPARTSSTRLPPPRPRRPSGAARRASPRFDVVAARVDRPAARARRARSARRARRATGTVRARCGSPPSRRRCPMLEHAVFVNDIPVTPATARRAAADRPRARSRARSTVSLAPGENRVRVEVSTGDLARLRRDVRRRRRAPRPRSAPPGDLYVLAVGVNEFPELKDANLAYAARDAEEVARFFRAAGPRHFRRVIARTLSDLDDEQARPRAHRRGARLRGRRGRARHGGRVPRLARRQRRAAETISSCRATHAPRTSPRSRTAAAPTRRRSFAGTCSSTRCAGVAGRRILIVDTCHARSVEGRADLQSLAKRSAASRFSLVLASKGARGVAGVRARAPRAVHARAARGPARRRRRRRRRRWSRSPRRSGSRCRSSSGCAIGRSGRRRRSSSRPSRSARTVLARASAAGAGQLRQ